MPIKFNCSSCGKRLGVSDNLAGRRGRCPQCKALFVVPTVTSTSPPPPPPRVTRQDPTDDDLRVDDAHAESATSTCPSCHASTPADSDFCEGCGAKLSPSNSALRSHTPVQHSTGGKESSPSIRSKIGTLQQSIGDTVKKGGPKARMIVIGLGALLVCVAGSVIWFAFGHRKATWDETDGPVYAGKPGGYWLVRLRDNDPKTRAEASGALANIGDPALPVLIGILKDEEEAQETRWYAILSLFYMTQHKLPGENAKDMVSEVTDLLQHPSSEIRATAAQVLAWTGQDARAAIPALLLLVRSPETWRGPCSRDDDSANLLIVGYVDTPLSPLVAKALLHVGASREGEIVPVLVGGLRDPDPRIRMNAALLLSPGCNISVLDRGEFRDNKAELERMLTFGLLGPPDKSAVPILIDLLRDSENVTRTCAAAILGKLGDDGATAIPALREMLDDPDSSVSRAAETALRDLGVDIQQERREGESLAHDLLVKAESVKSGAEQLKERGAIEEARLDYQEATKLLAAVVEKYPSCMSAKEAREDLTTWGTPTPESRAAFITHLRDKERVNRWYAAVVLGYIGEGSESEMQALATAASDPEESVRAAACESLGMLSLASGGEVPASGVPALMKALADPSDDVRAAAVWGLSILGPRAKDAVPVLLAALSDDSSSVNERAAAALVAIGLPAVEGLVRILSDRKVDYIVRQRAVESLGTMGPAAATAASSLAKGLDDREPSIRYACAQALPKLGQAAVPAVVAMLKIDNSEARKSAAQVLGSIGADAKDSTVHLIGAMSDSSEGVRQSAVEAIGKIGPGAAEVVPELAKRLKDDEYAVRLASARALEVLGTVAKDAIPALRDAAGAGDYQLRLAANDALEAMGATPVSGPPTSNGGADPSSSPTPPPAYTRWENLIAEANGAGMQGDLATMEAKVREALQLAESIPSDDPNRETMLTTTLEGLVEILDQRGKDAEAAEVRKRLNAPQPAGGAGDVNCPACGGKGKFACTTCKNGQVTGDCPTCKGRRTLACSRCKGQGSTPCDCGGSYKCPNCRGSGQIGCDSCGRSGRKDCTKCNGTGRCTTACPECKGKLTTTCKACNGTGRPRTAAEEAEDAARSMFAMADQFERNKLTDKAIEKYEELIKKYPDTNAAKEAAERLSALKSGK